VDGVVAELELRRQGCSVLRAERRPLDTIYLGGGTPSQLEPALMADLIAGTVDRLPHADEVEFTAEANPESLTDSLARIWRDLGINRVSLGVQSLDPVVLELLGRVCAPDTARRALRTAGQTFDRVSADWILGPGIRPAGLLDELDEALDLGVEHFSLYILEIHPGTQLAEQVADGSVKVAGDLETESVYLAAVEHLAKRGVQQYEVSNFARPGAESRHNRNYWTGSPWLALGPGAHGFWGNRRYANEDKLTAWLDRIAAGELPEAMVDRLDGAARQLERVILPLRTSRGVPLSRLPGASLDLEKGCAEGLWSVENEHLVLTSRGFLRIDTVEQWLTEHMVGPQTG